MPGLTKRQLLTATTTFGAMPTAQAPAQAQNIPAHEQASYEAARKEAELTWYSGPDPAETGEAAGKAFTQR